MNQVNELIEEVEHERAAAPTDPLTQPLGPSGEGNIVLDHCQEYSVYLLWHALRFPDFCALLDFETFVEKCICVQHRTSHLRNYLSFG